MSVVGMPQDAAPRVAAGRWPTNVALSHGCPVAELDAQSGVTRSHVPADGMTTRGGQRREAYGMAEQGRVQAFGDSGGASRFFPVFRYCAKAPARERPRIGGQCWPTVKPLALMRWLVRLVTPPGGTVLDCFAGTGTTLQAAQLEGFDSIGVERDPFAYALACQRLGLEVAG